MYVARVSKKETVSIFSALASLVLILQMCTIVSRSTNLCVCIFIWMCILGNLHPKSILGGVYLFKVYSFSFCVWVLDVPTELLELESYSVNHHVGASNQALCKSNTALNCWGPQSFFFRQDLSIIRATLTQLQLAPECLDLHFVLRTFCLTYVNHVCFLKPMQNLIRKNLENCSILIENFHFALSLWRLN